MYVFYLTAITAVGRSGAKEDPWGTNNTFSSAPSTEQDDKRHIKNRLRSGPAEGPSFCQEDFLGTGSEVILGQGPWRFGKGLRRAKHEHSLSCRSLSGRGSGVFRAPQVPE